MTISSAGGSIEKSAELSSVDFPTCSLSPLSAGVLLFRASILAMINPPTPPQSAAATAIKNRAVFPSGGAAAGSAPARPVRPTKFSIMLAGTKTTASPKSAATHRARMAANAGCAASGARAVSVDLRFKSMMCVISRLKFPRVRLPACRHLPEYLAGHGKRADNAQYSRTSHAGREHDRTHAA